MQKEREKWKRPEVDEALNHCFKIVLHKGVRISGLVLKTKAGGIRRQFRQI